MTRGYPRVALPILYFITRLFSLFLFFLFSSQDRGGRVGSIGERQGSQRQEESERAREIILFEGNGEQRGYPLPTNFLLHCLGVGIRAFLLLVRLHRNLRFMPPHPCFRWVYIPSPSFGASNASMHIHVCVLSDKYIPVRSDLGFVDLRDYIEIGPKTAKRDPGELDVERK